MTLLVSGIQQSESHTHILIKILFIIGYYKILSLTPCALE